MSEYPKLVFTTKKTAATRGPDVQYVLTRKRAKIGTMGTSKQTKTRKGRGKA